MKLLPISKQIAALPKMTVKQLRAKYALVFGEETNGHNKAWSVKCIAWRMQARAEGGLSERARQRASELADDADLRTGPPPMKAAPQSETTVHTVSLAVDDRLPPPGTIITRPYKGEVLQIKVRSDGFEYAGELFASLSAVAKQITGSHCNGFHFFRLNGKRGER